MTEREIPAASKKPSWLAAFYSSLRTSIAFMASLASFILVWVACHFAFGYDPDWGGLNLILSMEASLGMSLFMSMAAQHDAALEAILKEIRDQNRMILNLERAQVVQMEVLASFLRAEDAKHAAKEPPPHSPGQG
jgi:hypothetical protein